MRLINLTRVERKIRPLLFTGMNYTEIGEKLGMNAGYVSTATTRMLQKYELTSRVQLMAARIEELESMKKGD